jgi:hypothetical protein
VFLVGYGALLTLWLLLWSIGALPGGAPRAALALLLGALAAGSAGYTGALFGQCKGRVLWMTRGLWLALILRAATAGGAALLLCAPFTGLLRDAGWLRWVVAGALVLLDVYAALEGRLAPKGRQREHAEARRLFTKGPFARYHGTSLALGGVALICLVTGPGGFGAYMNALGGLLVLVSLWAHEEGFVKAGQALPIS